MNTKRGFVSIIAGLIALGALVVGAYAFKEHQRIVSSEYAIQEIQSRTDASPVQNVGADANVFTGGQTFRLSGAGITSSATLIGLTSFTLTQTGQELSTSDVVGTSGSVYLTIEPGNTSRQEFVSCTTVTQSGSDATATLSGCTRGLSAISPYTASSTLQFAHAGGSAVIISNSPAFYNQFAGKANDETITGIWDFSTSPTVPTPTTGTQAVNKAYVDGGLLAGAATSSETTTGISRLATQIQMASSTNTTPNTPLVLYSKYSTSSPYTAGLWIPITQNDGKLSPNFIATSSSYTYNWGGAQNFSASTTMTGTTTISASSLTSAPLVLRSLAYAAPSTRLASSTVLSDDGSGNLTWEYPSVKTLAADGANNSTSATSYTTVKTVTIPAGLLDLNDRITVYASAYRTAGSANDCQTRINFGSGSATTTVQQGTSGYSSGGNVQIWINNRNSLSSQFATTIIAPNNTSGVNTAASSTLPTANTANKTYLDFQLMAVNGADTCSYTGIYVKAEKIIN